MSSKINAEQTHSTFQKIAYDSKLIIQLFPLSVTSQTTSQRMESHMSFEWKNLDIISSQCKVGPVRILSEKTNQKTKWKQKSKTTTLLLTNFRQMFYTP